MAGLLALNDADLLRYILEQHQLMQQAQGYSFVDPGGLLNSPPGPTLENTPPPAPPPLPDRNPKRKAVEDAVNPEWLNALEMERQMRLGHSPRPYGEDEYSPDTYEPGKKRKSMKAI